MDHKSYILGLVGDVASYAESLTNITTDSRYGSLFYGPELVFDSATNRIYRYGYDGTGRPYMRAEVATEFRDRRRDEKDPNDIIAGS